MKLYQKTLALLLIVGMLCAYTGCKKKVEPIDGWMNAINDGLNITTGSVNMQIQWATPNTSELITLIGTKDKLEHQYEINLKKCNTSLLFGRDNLSDNYVLLWDTSTLLQSLPDDTFKKDDSSFDLTGAIITMFANKYLEFQFPQVSEQTTQNIHSFIQTILLSIKPTVAPHIEFDEKQGVYSLTINNELAETLLDNINDCLQTQECQELIASIIADFTIRYSTSSPLSIQTITDVIKTAKAFVKSNTVTLVTTIRTISGKCEFTADVQCIDINDASNTLSGSFKYSIITLSKTDMLPIDIPANKRINPLALFSN